MKNRYVIQHNTSNKFDVIDTEYGLVQEPSMIEHDAVVHAAMLNCEHLRDVRRAAKEQRKGRANNETAPLPSDRLMNFARNNIWGR